MNTEPEYPPNDDVTQNESTSTEEESTSEPGPPVIDE